MYTVISRSLACSYVQTDTGIVGLLVPVCVILLIFSAAVSGSDGTADNGTVSCKPHSQSADRDRIIGLSWLVVQRVSNVFCVSGARRTRLLSNVGFRTQWLRIVVSRVPRCGIVERGSPEPYRE